MPADVDHQLEGGVPVLGGLAARAALVIHGAAFASPASSTAATFPGAARPALGSPALRPSANNDRPETSCRTNVPLGGEGGAEVLQLLLLLLESLLLTTALYSMVCLILKI